MLPRSTGWLEASDLAKSLQTQLTPIFVFDDWNASGLADRNMGEARAFAEFVEAHPQLTVRRLEGLNYKDKVDPEILLVTRS